MAVEAQVQLLQCPHAGLQYDLRRGEGVAHLAVQLQSPPERRRYFSTMALMRLTLLVAEQM